MTIRNTLTEIYPDFQFMGTRQLGTKYVLFSLLVLQP